ncbi:MAG TPA: M17 family peptidase N-terminal domain-containing protein [Candidatus Deferrimicrobium sp.]|nr:M17 family peptidase N-terminal domain-containing protein [Candidatus Deferrimicrobium sp.]
MSADAMAAFSPVPSSEPGRRVSVSTATTAPAGVALGLDGATPDGPDALRDAAATHARSCADQQHVAVLVPGGIAPAEAAAAIVEGALLARYRYDVLRSRPTGTPLEELTLVTSPDAEAAVSAGAARGQTLAAATALARDLANTPHSHLTATRLGEIATQLGPAAGLGVEITDKAGLIAERIGGLLAINQGSAEPPVMIKLTYRPDGSDAGTGHLALVGKGIMYDSGGIALKPGDAVHARMKNDMSGAAAILAAMLQLRALGCTTAVTGWLMCTDSMPSSTALAMGDVIVHRDGTTVEIANTDAEGRIVMADGLVLAREAAPDAILDIATLTGAMMRALGSDVAGVIGNHDGLVEAVRAAGTATGEPAWPMPLWRGYAGQLDSTVADMKNLGWGDGGAITAALFLEHFVGDVPWAHLDIAGTAWSDTDRGPLTAGCTGFGARLLVQLALDFSPPNVDTAA